MNSAPPKVSIVITCFNYVRYVGTAIDSALRQTWPQTEIIVVDDGSTDGSSNVMTRYAGHVQILRQENAGQAAAGYNGFMVSSGDIVIFLDADDLLLPTAAEEVANSWQPTCVKVQYDLTLINGDGERLRRRFCNFVPSYNAEKLRKDFATHGSYVHPVMSGNAYSRWYLKLMLPIASTRVLDGVLNTVAPVYGDIFTIPKSLGCYRLHGANYSSRGRSETADLKRFADSIGYRNKELVELRKHAEYQKVALPSGNLLDNDLVFINYRMMMKKLGVPYDNGALDTVGHLWLCAVIISVTRPLPFRVRAMHLLWFSLLYVAPRPCARWLILLRYSRADYFQNVRRKMNIFKPN